MSLVYVTAFESTRGPRSQNSFSKRAKEGVSVSHYFSVLSNVEALTIPLTSLGIDLAEKHAFKVYSYRGLKRFIKERSKYRPQWYCGHRKTKEEAVEQVRFLNTTLLAVKQYCRRPGAAPGVGSQERMELFERYAALLNHLEVKGKGKIDLLGVDECSDESKPDEMFTLEEFLLASKNK